MEGLWGEGEAGTGEVLAMVSIRYRVMSGLMCRDEAPGTRALLSHLRPHIFSWARNPVRVL